MGLISGAASLVGGPVAGFAVAHWRGILLAVMVATVVGSAWYYVWNLHHQIDKLTKENATLTTNLNDCKQATADLTMSVTTQNKTIENLQKQGAIAAQAAASANRDAAVIGKAYADTVDKMSRQPKPVDCNQATIYLKDRTELKWDKK